MFIYGSYSQWGRMVEGLGDEEIPWWIAPYVRNFAELANSQALIETQQHAAPVGAATSKSPKTQTPPSAGLSRISASSAFKLKVESDG